MTGTTMEHAFHEAAERTMARKESKVKYPNIVFDTHGMKYARESLVEHVLDELEANEVDSEEQECYRKQALGGDYETAVVVTGQWVTLR